MKKNILAVFAAIDCTAIFISCTNVEGATEALLDAGLHPVHLGGYAPYQCGKGDIYATEFLALSPDSTRVVSGVVCEGWLKGKTIRYN